MAIGVQSLTALAATTYTNIAAGPSSGRAQVLTVSFCNRGSGGTVRLAVATTGTSTPASTDWLEYDSYVSANSVLERTGIVLGTGQILLAYASSANFSVTVYGLEDVASATSGILGRYSLAANTDTAITTTPASGRFQSISVNFVNTTASTVNVRLGVSTTPTAMTTAQYLEYDYPLPAGAVLERTGIVVNNTYSIGARASATGVTVVAYGIDSPV